MKKIIIAFWSNYTNQDYNTNSIDLDIEMYKFISTNKTIVVKYSERDFIENNAYLETERISLYLDRVIDILKHDLVENILIIMDENLLDGFLEAINYSDKSNIDDHLADRDFDEDSPECTDQDSLMYGQDPDTENNTNAFNLYVDIQHYDFLKFEYCRCILDNSIEGKIIFNPMIAIKTSLGYDRVN